MGLYNLFTHLLSYVFQKKEQKQYDDFGYIGIPPQKKEILEKIDLIDIV